jgi:HD-GYP domain-containing protein (c-di-GMP phosphodiesterase class II)
MHKRAEVLYRDGSALRGLAESFQNQYCIRAVMFSNTEILPVLTSNLQSEVSDRPAIVLADLGHPDDIMISRNFKQSVNLRFIGFLPENDRVENHQTGIRAGKTCFALLHAGVSRGYVEAAIEAAIASIESDARNRTAAEHEREELNRIGIALSSTRDVNVLLELILAKTREITGADAGSLYIVETSGSENGLSGRQERRLRFKLTQNDTKQFPYSEFTLPMNENSMAGYAALHGEVIVHEDVYLIPLTRPYRFNATYDDDTGYRTRSVLTVPMKNARDEVIGVMQVLNRKRSPGIRLLTPADVEREVEPFPERAIRLAESLASQAAVAYENSQLYQNIHNLFEGFVNAAATAIEQRDPTTSGHSVRVTTMTLGLAEAVSRTQSGPYATVHFTIEQMKEIRYAALLHDFGKIAVREQLLVKARKLYPPQLDILRQRFDYLHQALEAERAQQKLDALLACEKGVAQFPQIDQEFAAKQAELQEDWRFLVRTNEATVLPEGQFGRLNDIARKVYLDPTGIKRSLLTPGEMISLSVRQGTLNEDERQEIESHVVHSFNFLTHIPWTQELRFIPWIVRAHHEKLNGKGYPYRLRGDEIPIQAQIMVICDVFDALCSADRPYKKAVPLNAALEILEAAAHRNEIDPELFRIFTDARIYELAHTPDAQLQSADTVRIQN